MNSPAPELRNVMDAIEHRDDAVYVAVDRDAAAERRFDYRPS